MTGFSVLTVNIISMFIAGTKEDTIDNIMGAMPYITDSEMKKLAEQTIIMLDSITEKDFAEIDFTADYDED